MIQECLLSIQLNIVQLFQLNIMLEILANLIGEKNLKDIRIRKEKIMKFFLFTYDKIGHGKI